jgi:hypothetical protein
MVKQRFASHPYKRLWHGFRKRPQARAFAGGENYALHIVGIVTQAKLAARANRKNLPGSGFFALVAGHGIVPE